MDKIKASILLVEDDAITALMGKNQLERYGYEVHHVKTGEEAVATVAEQKLPVDLILMDIDLGPGIDGTEAAAQILAIKDMPVLFCSSHNEREIVEKTENISGYGYVVKNSGITVLDASIKMALKLFTSKMEHLKTEKERQRLLGYLEKALDEIYIFNGRDLHFEYVNNGAIRNLGYTFDELKTMTPIDIKPEYTEAKFREFIRPLIEGRQEELHFETVHRRKDGSTYPVEIHLRYNPGPDGGTFSAFIMDISERKHSEEALRESEALFRHVFEQHKAVKLLIDPEDGRILDANLVAVEFYGWSREQLCSMHIQEINTLSPEAVAKEMAKAVENKRNYFQFKHRLADGSVRDVEVYSSKLEMRGKAVLHSIVHDDTDRKRAEEALKKQLAEKEILLREVHHRVKNNMANLMALLKFQANETANAEVRQGLEEAIARTESMQSLYEKLLLSGEYREISMKNYLEDLVNSILEIFTFHCAVTLEMNISDIPLDIKRAGIIGIITNELLTNTLKYAFADRTTGTIRISLEKTEDQIRLVIKDDGPGFDAQSLMSKSTGFGLTLVNMLAEELKGSFTMQNDHGTISTVQFPL
ncbi:PAS domain S-box protein [Gracilinema caldarium]|uniref:PAS domain S-box protein n=1 Tax=Gracilinema caldarium TaxID=215591 RepID=UPI0026EB4463|nr:PAS domain S-box protein [Gracilinema caldarium]